MSDRVWVGEAAGPLLLLPDSLLTDWSGIDVPEYRVVKASFRWNAEEPRACDYDRACDIAQEVGVIEVGHGHGLVLSGGLQPTTWLERQWGGLIARWVHAENDADMQAALAAIPEPLAWERKADFAVVSSPLVLFNSAEPGEEILMPRLTVELSPGLYEVRWANYTPDERTSLALVELRLAPVR